MNDIDKRIMQALTTRAASLEIDLHNSEFMRREAEKVVEEVAKALQDTTDQLMRVCKALEEVQEATLRQEIILPPDWQIVPKVLTTEIWSEMQQAMYDSDETKLTTQEYWTALLAAAPKWKGGTTNILTFPSKDQPHEGV